MKKNLTWCQLTEKEAERRNPDSNKTKQCMNYDCFDCHGDHLSY